jgi:hypothetical protein
MICRDRLQIVHYRRESGRIGTAALRGASAFDSPRAKETDHGRGRFRR